MMMKLVDTGMTPSTEQPDGANRLKAENIRQSLKASTVGQMLCGSTGAVAGKFALHWLDISSDLDPYRWITG